MHLLFLFILLLSFSPKALAGINLELARSESEISTTDGKHVYQPRLFIEKRRGLTAFSLDVVAYKPDETEIAYGEIVFRNLGIHLTNVSIGALFGYKHFGPKFVENEFDFSINRGILGGYISYSDSWFLADFSYASYNPVKSHSSKVDSFELSVSASPIKNLCLLLVRICFLKWKHRWGFYKVLNSIMVFRTSLLKKPTRRLLSGKVLFKSH